MLIDKFFESIWKIRELPLFPLFRVYLHGGILAHPESTTDIDLKILPRNKFTIKQLEEFMTSLNSKGFDATFMRKINSYQDSLKPTLSMIDDDPPVLQAVYNKDLEKLIVNNKKYDKRYIYREKIHYKQIGKLIFYMASEWAICGHKFNQQYQTVDTEDKEKLFKNPRLNIYAKVKANDNTRAPNYQNIQLRDIAFLNSWDQFKHSYLRL